MFGLIGSGLVVVVVALGVYLGLERLGTTGLGLAALRTVGLGALVLLFFNPARSVQTSGGPPVVLLDASLSMGAEGADWQAAVDTALALAGSDGTILRFGSSIAPFDTAEPTDGLSRVADALATARAMGGGVHVVSDGELSGAGRLQPLEANLVLVPRDTVPNAAVLDLYVPRAVQAEDSVVITLTIGTWGSLESDTAVVEVFEDARRIVSRNVVLPQSPGVGRRQMVIPPGRLSLGSRVVRVELTTPGDREPRDDVRMRVTSVTDLPSMVVLVDPADYEGRFLFQELNDIARGSVRGYARVADDRWVEMGSMRVMRDRQVARATQAAALVVHRSMQGRLPVRSTIPTWSWPAGQDAEGEFFEGDWYLTEELPASPLLGSLVGVAWDSLPPLTGLLPLVPAEAEWVALSVRRSRRGAARAAVIGVDTGGTRHLTTAATGLWRWGFRGGAAREAYRTMLAAGVDWLLGSRDRRSAVPLVAEVTTTRGVPIRFTWVGDSIPNAVAVLFRGDTTQFERVLRFDQSGASAVMLDPDVYRWTLSGGAASGIVVVEPYSDEFHASPVVGSEADRRAGFILSERFVRQRWWLFAIAILAFAAEWGWRLRRGLP